MSSPHGCPQHQIAEQPTCCLCPRKSPPARFSHRLACPCCLLVGLQVCGRPPRSTTCRRAQQLSSLYQLSSHRHCCQTSNHRRAARCQVIDIAAGHHIIDTAARYCCQMSTHRQPIFSITCQITDTAACTHLSTEVTLSNDSAICSPPPCRCGRPPSGTPCRRIGQRPPQCMAP